VDLLDKKGAIYSDRPKFELYELCAAKTQSLNTDVNHELQPRVDLKPYLPPVRGKIQQTPTNAPDIFEPQQNRGLQTDSDAGGSDAGATPD
jgi:hypothetical protein